MPIQASATGLTNFVNTQLEQAAKAAEKNPEKADSSKLGTVNINRLYISRHTGDLKQSSNVLSHAWRLLTAKTGRGALEDSMKALLGKNGEHFLERMMQKFDKRLEKNLQNLQGTPESSRKDAREGAAFQALGKTTLHAMNTINAFDYPELKKQAKEFAIKHAEAFVAKALASEDPPRTLAKLQSEMKGELEKWSLKAPLVDARPAEELPSRDYLELTEAGALTENQRDPVLEELMSQAALAVFDKAFDAHVGAHGRTSANS